MIPSSSVHNRCHPERSEGSQRILAAAKRLKFSHKKPEPASSAETASGFSAAFRTTNVKPFLKMTAAAVCAIALTGCKSTPPPKPLNQLTVQEQSGHRLFQQNCAMCHYDRETGSLHGPSLLGVYKKPYLQSGAPANDERITWTIQHGRGMMPPLGDQLSDADIADILAYLKTL